jgi:chromosomal replication initiator protein
MDTLAAMSARIAEKLGPQKYKVWFKNATQFTLVGHHVKVSAPNAFLCGWIERNFADQIAESAREVTGQDHQVSFVVDPKLQVALKKRQLNSQADFIAKNPERIARQYKREGQPPARKLRGRFEDLVVGPANELAVSVIRRVADPGAEAYSPVFIHGACGLGKTHLVQALANEMAEKHAQTRWLYTTGDEFTNEFILAIRSGRSEAFRQRYRHLDVLIIDDIHFLANKKATQEEFLHTFNAIDGHRRRIVLTSDTHPKLIGQFSEQLVNRFMAGMVVRLEVPDFAMRCEILRRRAARVTGQPIPEDVIAYIADHLTSNVRELEGALLKLLMFSTISHQPITLSLARRALADHIERSRRSLGLDEIDQTVATYFGLTPADLHTSRKTRTIALARGIAMYLARKHTEMSFPEIGRFMGNKNHSTVILASRKIAGLLEADEVVCRQTPAGQKDERLRDIVAKVEEQLGLAARTGQPASPVPDRAAGPRRTPPAPAPIVSCGPVTAASITRAAMG